MSGSSITTRRILCGAMKSLMEERPFSTISVKNICERCDINRKSFYYHYHDKFDLVNNIYNVEFYDAACEKKYDSIWEFFTDLAEYLNTNRKFYRNAFNVEGQNSFSECFCDSLSPLLKNYLEQTGCSKSELKKMTQYACIMISAATQFWLRDKTPQSPREFALSLKMLLDQQQNEVSSRLKDYTIGSGMGIGANVYNR